MWTSMKNLLTAKRKSCKTNLSYKQMKFDTAAPDGFDSFSAKGKIKVFANNTDSGLILNHHCLPFGYQNSPICYCMRNDDTRFWIGKSLLLTSRRWKSWRHFCKVKLVYMSKVIFYHIDSCYSWNSYTWVYPCSALLLRVIV